MKILLNIMIIIPALVFHVYPSGSRAGNNGDQEKKNRCEKICKVRNGQCRKYAVRDKSKAVCGSLFSDCMNKCQKIGN